LAKNGFGERWGVVFGKWGRRKRWCCGCNICIARISLVDIARCW